MSKTIKIVGLSGSIRAASVNTGLLIAASKRLPPNVTMEIADMSKLPIYNDDLWQGKSDDSALPEPIRKMRAQIAAADCILFANPEYNFSVSSVLKTGIDWASKNPNCFAGKPAAIMGAGGGNRTALSAMHLRGIGVFLNLHFLNQPAVAINRFAPPHNTAFDAVTGELVDEGVAATIEELVKELVAMTLKLQG